VSGARPAGEGRRLLETATAELAAAVRGAGEPAGAAGAAR